MADIDPDRITTIEDVRKNPEYTTFFVHPSNATLKYISNPKLGKYFKFELNDKEIYIGLTDLLDFLENNVVKKTPVQSGGRRQNRRRSYSPKNRTYKRRSYKHKKRSHKHKY